MINKYSVLIVFVVFLLALLFVIFQSKTFREGNVSGVYDDRIVLGAVLPLQGEFGVPGLRMESGLRLSLDGAVVNGRTITLLTSNDYYDQKRSVEQTKKLLNQGVFAMIGNVGERNAQVTLPLLEAEGVPSVAFLDGSDVSYVPRPLHFQFRPSFRQEAKKMLKALFNQGVLPEQICAYVQQDISGLTVLKGIRESLKAEGGSDAVLRSWDTVINAAENQAQDWNNLGPVGSYQLNKVLSVKPGFASLEKWESANKRCLVVMTYGFELNLGNFIRYSLAKNKAWAFTAFSFSGSKRMFRQFQNHNIQPLFYMTRVVPTLDSDLPIVNEFRSLDIPEMTDVGLEGYIVGKMILAALEKTKDLTRENFIDNLRKLDINLGGVTLNSSRNEGQYASDLIIIIRLKDNILGAEATADDWQPLQKLIKNYK
jgi:ABC-type branched-subunit amino acid transport system substrate-binding protein